MAYTTHQQIRVEAGFQSRFVQIPTLNQPTGSTTKFLIDTDDLVKFVPEFNTGNTVAGISDIAVFVGIAGLGFSRMAISSVDIDGGTITLTTAPANGASLVASYASSAIPNYEIEQVRLRAEATLSQRLAQCYDLPIATDSAYLAKISTELASALLLIRNFGTSSRDTAADGYAIYEKLLGNNESMAGEVNGQGAKVMNGEIGLICTPGFVLVDDNSNIIPRNDGDVNANSSFQAGGRVTGRIYDITEEEFRYKNYQVDVNRNQSGSGKHSLNNGNIQN